MVGRLNADPIVKLSPAFKDYLWGGTRIKEQFNKESNMSIIAESWELSAHPDGESRVADGEFTDFTLSEYIKAVGKEERKQRDLKSFRSWSSSLTPKSPFLYRCTPGMTMPSE